MVMFQVFKCSIKSCKENSLDFRSRLFKLRNPKISWQFKKFVDSIENFATNGILSFYQDKDCHWRINAVNNAYLIGVGSKREDIIYKSLEDMISQFVPDEHKQAKVEEIKMALDNRDQKKQIEMPYYSANGSIRTVAFHLDFRPFGAVVVMQDIHKQKRLETKLAEMLKEIEMTNIRNYDFKNDLPIGALEISPQGKVIFGNKRAIKMLGYNDQDIKKGLNVFDVITEKSRNKAIENMKKRIEGKLDKPSRYEVYHKDGSVIPVEIDVNPVFNANKELNYFNVSFDDIRERKRQRDELRKALQKAKENEIITRDNEEKYRSIVESLDLAYYEVDLKGTITFVNSHFCKLFGADPDKIVGKNYRSFILNSEEVFQVFNDVFNTGIGREKEIGWKMSIDNGEVIDIEASVNPKYDRNEQIIGFRGVFEDVTQKIVNYKQLEEQKNFFRDTFETIYEGILISDNDKVVYANPSILKMLGLTYQDVIGKNGLDFVIEDQREYVRDMNKSSKESIYETRLLHKNGNILTVEIKTKKITYMGESARLIACWDVSKKEEESAMDKLTGAYTMKYFYRDLISAVKRTRRAETRLVLFTIDANNLKYTNDNYGHKYGDQLLISIVEAVKECVRREDNIYRRTDSGNGSDEFLVIMEGIDQDCGVDVPERVNKIIDLLHDYAKEYEKNTGIKVPFEASIGYSYLDPSKDNVLDQIITKENFKTINIDDEIIFAALEEARYIKKIKDNGYTIQSAFYYLQNSKDLEIDFPNEIKKIIRDIMLKIPGIYHSMMQLIENSDNAMYIAKRRSQKELEELLAGAEGPMEPIKKSAIAYYKNDSEIQS